VAAIDHTYESFATAFPDGRVTTSLARAARRRGEGFWEKLVAGRAADVSFVLSELTGAHPAWPGAALIDPSRIAMAGHSIGGAAAIAALVADSRIRAGIDMDGTLPVPVPDEGLARPFLLLGKQSNYTPGSGGPVTTWERDWRRLTGWKRWLLVAGAIHASFTDLALLADQAGIDAGAGLSGARSLDITRAYVRAFFDQHLRGEPQALLDQPSPRYPEVTFCSPEEELPPCSPPALIIMTLQLAPDEGGAGEDAGYFEPPEGHFVSPIPAVGQPSPEMSDSRSWAGRPGRIPRPRG
jgi:hypothetical protein